MTNVFVVVEGASDEQAARAILRHCGRDVHDVRVSGGKTRLDPKIPNYIRAARHGTWVIFRDTDGECPVTLRERLLSGETPESSFALRLAHSMTEAWLMADRSGFATYFHVSPDSIPSDPDGEPHAKRTLLTICRKSRDRRIREGVVHDSDHAGPEFVYFVNEFARTAWRVEAAMENSPSLRRAVQAISAMPVS